jgi:hypothetical protein
MTTKQESIRVGDRFEAGNGRVWAVYRTRPGGVVEMVAEDKMLQCDMYTRNVRLMKRLEGRNERALRYAQYTA